MRQAAGAARALTGHTHLMVSSLDGHRSHLNRDRTAVYSTSGMSKSLFGEELDETGGDGGGIPARQVVARARDRHRVDFWNPLRQEIGGPKEKRETITAPAPQPRGAKTLQALGFGIFVVHGP